VTETSGEDPGDPIRVLIVDDHDVVALGLQALLDDVHDLEVVGTAGSVAEGVAAVERRRPDVVLADYRLPDGTGAELAERLGAMGLPTPVVMITAAADRRVVSKALDAGCAGFVSKNADRDDLTAAVRAAAAHDAYFTRDVLEHLVHLRRFDQVESDLSVREVEVLQLTADGLSTVEIAEQLFLSQHTVKNHLRHAMAKLEAHTKLEAVVKAVRAHLITID